jgi:1,4-dihydroxy-2-naphthoate octaprenyltransferase
LNGLRTWAMAARPRTLPAALAPVLVGSAAAWAYTIPRVSNVPGGLEITWGPGSFSWGNFVAALIGAVFIQIGTNLANDYSDAKRGADTVDRLGPVRVTAAGLVAPRRVLHATWAAFGVAALAGLYLTIEVGPEILAIGILSIAAGVLYTGGPKPYGYEGLGEVFVFVFFGLVAVNGSYYVQLEDLAWLPVLLSVPVGLLSAAILVVNNVRDIDTDRRAGKRTLAVRLGRERTRSLYVALVAGAFLILPVGLIASGGPAWALLGVAAAPLARRPAAAVLDRTDGPALNGALAGTGALLAAFSVLVSLGLLIAA